MQYFESLKANCHINQVLFSKLDIMVEDVKLILLLAVGNI
jgi:hypothetical protein